jgi:hypothetical protein
MTSSGLKPAGTPSWCSVIQWFVSRSVAGSSKRMTQPTPRISPIAWKSAFQLSVDPKDWVSACARPEPAPGWGSAARRRLEK